MANNVGETFAGGKYAVITLDKDTILYRAGIEGQPLGQFFSLEKPKSVIQTRIDKAILSEWPNGAKSPLDTSYSIKIPAGTKIYVGDVGTQRDFYLEGTQQIVVPKPWTIKDVKVVESSSLK